MKSIILNLSLLITLTSSQDPQEVRCQYEIYNDHYSCFLTSVDITTASIPLTFSSIHSGGRSRLNVTMIRTPSTGPNPVNINIFHPQFFDEFPNLQKIILPSAAMKTLTLEYCGKIDEIDLYGSLLTELPSRMFSNCSNLKTLDLGYNDIDSIYEDSLRGLFSLEFLSLRLNMNVNIFNNSLEDSTNLREFYFAGNGNIEIGSLRNAKNLEKIEISYSRPFFDDIKLILSGLNNLKSIDLTNNGFMRIDFQFFRQFQKLEKLTLDDNGLTSIPNGSFDGFQSLKHFSIVNNFISIINNETFVALENLETLSLRGNGINDLSSLPFEKLTKLYHLCLNDNFILTLPDKVFEKNRKMWILQLDKNMLIELPVGIFDPMIDLTILSLTGNRLKSLQPNTFISFPNLIEINLSNNQITRLNSNSFGKMENLKTFDIQLNDLEEIEPNFFENFPNLIIFGGFGNICMNLIITDVNLVDFNGENEFSECFYNWKYGRTTTEMEITSTTDTTTTTEGSGGKIQVSVKIFGVLMVFLRFLFN